MNRPKRICSWRHCITSRRRGSGGVVLALGWEASAWNLKYSPQMEAERWPVYLSHWPSLWLSLSWSLSPRPSVCSWTSRAAGSVWATGCCTTGGAALWRSVARTSILLASLHSWLYACPDCRAGTCCWSHPSYSLCLSAEKCPLAHSVPTLRSLEEFEDLHGDLVVFSRAGRYDDAESLSLISWISWFLFLIIITNSVEVHDLIYDQTVDI